MLTVYTKPSCVQCDMTKRVMDREGIEYEMVDVTKDGDALMTIKDLGYLQVPVVVDAIGDHWSGFQPDRILAAA